MKDSDVERVSTQCADCGSTDTLSSDLGAVCKVCSKVLCWQCSLKHQHDCDCCGKSERSEFVERCATCGKLVCPNCIYSHPCPFPFRAKGRVWKKAIPGEWDKLESEERARKLASELWAAIFTALDAPYVLGPTFNKRTNPAVPKELLSEHLVSAQQKEALKEMSPEEHVVFICQNEALLEKVSPANFKLYKSMVSGPDAQSLTPADKRSLLVGLIEASADHHEIAANYAEVPEAARAPMLFGAVVFAALDAILRAQRAYGELQLRQFVSVLGRQLALCVAVSLETTNGKESDLDVLCSEVRVDLDHWLLLRYEQFRIAPNLSAIDRYYLRFFRLVFGKLAGDESFLSAMISDHLSRSNVTIPAWMLNAFVKRVSTEVNGIDSAFFARSS